MAAPRAALERAFGALAALQPVRWTREGLVCAPRAAPEAAGPALAGCPFPIRTLAAPPAWPDPPAALVAGFYRRSPEHVPAPAGWLELVQVPGPGFGPHDHATTAMCLAGLRALPAGLALDAGAGSGLLAQAWARLGRGPVLAVELDPGALAQARASARAAGLGPEQVAFRGGPLERLDPAELAGRVLLANHPAPAQAALLERAADAPAPPRAALLSGLRPGEAAPLVTGWRALGLAPAGAARRGRFERWTLLAR